MDKTPSLIKAEIGIEGEMERVSSLHSPQNETLLLPSADTLCSSKQLKKRNTHIAQTGFLRFFAITIILLIFYSTKVCGL